MKWLPPTQELRITHIYYLIISIGQESGNNLSESSASGHLLQVSQGCTKVSAKASVSSQASVEEGSVSKLLWLLVEFHSLWLKWLSFSLSSWLLDGGFLYFLAMWVSPLGILEHRRFLHQIQKEKESTCRMDYNLIYYNHRSVSSLLLQYSID